MPDPLLYPDEENSDILKNYIDLQKQLADILLKQAKNSENLSHINLDLEAQVNSRLSKQGDLLKLNEDELRNLVKIKEQTVGTTDVLSDQAVKSILAAKQRIADNLELVAIYGMQNDLEISAAKKRFDEENRWYTFASKRGIELFGLKMEEYELTKSIGEELEKYPFKLQAASGIIAAILVILKKAYDLFKSFDKAAWDFRKAIGITRNDMKGIRSTAERLAIDFMNVGVTIEGSYEAIKSLGKEMGGVHIVSKDLIKTTALLKAQLGVSEETTAGFLRNMAGISKSSMEAQKDTAYMAVNMANAAGVNLGDVMSDISKASGTTLVMMSRLPTVVLRTAIEAKRLGTSISQIAKSSREILNFSDSINAELEASVLLGRGINLQRARELAYRRDLEGSTKEILRITKQIDFENLDVFQQEAFARATGKSVDELLRMVVAERQWDAARKDPTLVSRVAAYDKIRALNEATLKTNAKNTELFLMQKSNQERLTAISQKWNQILAKAGEIFLPVIDKLLAGVGFMMEYVTQIMILKNHFADLLMFVGSWITSLAKGQIFAIGLADHLGKVGKVMSVIYNIGKSVFSVIATAGKSLGFIGKFLGMFGKFLGPIGWVITAFQFVGALIRRFSEADFVKGDWIGNIWKGIKAIGGALFDTLLKPFVDAFNWLFSSWLPHSPESPIGSLIVKGIAAIGGTLFDVLTDPFRRGFAWILDKLPGMGKFAEKIRGGIGGMLAEPLENKATSAYVPALQVTPEETKFTVPTKKPGINTEVGAEESSDGKVLQDILLAINTLNNNLENGKIGFYVDGQLLSATIARQTEFRGGFGTNKIN